MTTRSDLRDLFVGCAPKRVLVGRALSPLLITLLGISASAREIQAPSPEDIYLMSYAISKTNPDFKALARTTQEYHQASEFERPKIVDRTASQLKKQYEAVSDVDSIVLTIDGYLGEYDSDYKEFVLKTFSGDAYVSLRAFGQEVRIHFNNAAKFVDWHLDPSAAESVFNRNKKNRNIKLVVSVKPVSAHDESSEVRRIDAEITRVVVRSSWSGLELGHLP